MIVFQEDSSSGYRERTIANASADATIAIALDFKTAGEKLTKEAVKNQGKVYIPIDGHDLTVSQERVDKIVKKLNSIKIEQSVTKGVNIYSNASTPLARALSNPTHYNFKVEDAVSIKRGGIEGFESLNNGLLFNGEKYLDVEEAYFKLRTATGPTPENISLMLDLIEQKFLQNPSLYLAVNKMGGYGFLKSCTHIIGQVKAEDVIRVTDMSGWCSDEGDAFIACLAEAYKRIAGTEKFISLNVAGNGIYTMKGFYKQKEVDDFTYELLKAVVSSPDLKNKIGFIRSGGQTGFDEAGAKAGEMLNIPTLVYAPKGWRFRTLEADISDEKLFKLRFDRSINYEAFFK
jgi:hypothetical protein